MAESHTPETFAAARAAVEAARPDGGSPFERCCALLFVPFLPRGRRRAAVLEAAKTMLAFNVDVLRRLDPGLAPSGLRSLDVVARPGLWRELGARIPDSVAEQTVLAGSPERCAERLREYAASGCTHAVLEPWWALSPQEALEAVAAASAVRAALLPG